MAPKSVCTMLYRKIRTMIDGMLKKKIDSKMIMAVPVVTKFEIALYYLATGDYLNSLEYILRVRESIISEVFAQFLAPFYTTIL